MVMRTETEAAIRAVRTAQQIADSRDGVGAITSKGGIDLVTAADVACEDAIRVELGTSNSPKSGSGKFRCARTDLVDALCAGETPATGAHALPADSSQFCHPAIHMLALAAVT
jgi:hypothetical protein